ncbi:hypothetical protein MJO29_004792, partial [Puccinia striiformis f. sp. tritici]
NAVKSSGFVPSQPTNTKTGLRRLSRVSSVTSRHPSSVCPPSDSRRAIARPPTTANKKRPRSCSVLEAEEMRPKVALKSKKTLKRRTQQKGRKTTKIKQNKTKCNNQNNSEAGWIVDLCKDSETEDPKTAPGKKFDAARIFFGEAFYLSKVTKKDHPITFICKWCKKQVCGARDTGANLRKHQDGSNQVGRDGSGCPKQNLAIQAGAFLPPTEGDEEAEESEDKSGSDIENVEDPMDLEPEHDEEELAEFLKQQEQAGEKFVEEEIEFAATNRNEANAMDSLTKKVIDEMLKEDLERVHTRRARQRGQTSRKELGYFQEITILSHEWQSIKELNDELEKMEGDGPAGSIAIPEYLKLAIFESHFQAEAPRAEARLIELFDGRKNEIVEAVTQSKEHEKKSTEKKDKEKEKENDDIYSFFSGPSNEPGKDEIEMYLGGMDCMDRGEKNYTFSALKWW